MKREEKKSLGKKSLALFTDHNGSFPKLQPGATRDTEPIAVDAQQSQEVLLKQYVWYGNSPPHLWHDARAQQQFVICAAACYLCMSCSQLLT